MLRRLEGGSDAEDESLLAIGGRVRHSLRAPGVRVGEIVMTVQLASATGPRGGLWRYLAPIVLVIAAAAVIAVVVSAPDHSGRRASATIARPATARRLPPYWIVRPGDSFMDIAARTGVSIAR